MLIKHTYIYTYIHTYMYIHTHLEELVLQWAEGADEVRDVIGYDDDLPALRTLRSEHGQFPCQHANLLLLGKDK